MTSVNTNVSALAARYYLANTNKEIEQSIQSLSSGFKVNSAADDAAGLVIAARMEAQTRSLTMAIKNANDAVSLARTAEGALGEVTNMLQRIRELAVQSANGTMSYSDRASIDTEVQFLKAEIDRVGSTTTFNGQNLLDGSYSGKFQIGDKDGQNVDLKIASAMTSALGIGEGGSFGNALVSARVDLSAAISSGDILINGRSLDAIAANSDFESITDNINRNVSSVFASGFNTVVAPSVGDGVTGGGGTDRSVGGATSNGGLRITTGGPGSRSDTVFTISASSDMDELIANIQNETGGVVTASKNKHGALVLSNNSGSTITVEDDSMSGGSGFSSARVSFNGFLKLEAKNSAPITIENGNAENIGKASLSLSGTQSLLKADNVFQTVPLDGAAPLASGGFVATFRRGNDHYYQRFDSDGDKVGDQIELLINRGGSNPDDYHGNTIARQTKILELSNGSLVFSFISRNKTKFSLFDSQDNEIISFNSVSETSANDYSDNRIVDLGAGRFAIDYTHSDRSSVSTRGLTSNKLVIFDYDGNVVQGEFEYSTKRFNDRSDMFAMGGNRIAMIDASIPHYVSFNQQKYNLTFNILDIQNQEVIKRTDIVELNTDSDTYGTWESPRNSFQLNQTMHFNMAKASNGFYVTFQKSSELFIAKIDEDGEFIKPVTSLSLDGLPANDYRSLDIVELTPEVFVANFSHSASGAQSVVKLFDAQSFEAITSRGEGVSLVVDSSTNHASDGKMIFDGENRLTVFTQSRDPSGYTNETFLSGINVNLPHDPVADLSRLGLRQTQADTVDDGYTMRGKALTSAGVAAGYGQSDLTINGVEIYDADIATTSFNGKLKAINSFSDQTGVTASASFSKSFGIDTANLGAGGKFELNGKEITLTDGTLANLVGDINQQTATTGLKATMAGNNVTLEGENIQTVTIGYQTATEVTNGMTSAVNAVQSAVTDDRTVTIAAVDVVEGRVFTLASTDSTAGAFSVTHTVATGETETDVAAALVAALRAHSTAGADMRDPTKDNVANASGVITISGFAANGHGTDTTLALSITTVPAIFGAATTHYAGIKLDSLNNTPIKIDLGQGTSAANHAIRHGFLEANVGAADFDVNEPTLGVSSGSSISGLSLASFAGTSSALGTIDNAIDSVNAIRSDLGAFQNRLDHTINNLSSVANNTEGARGRIVDADFASETANLTKQQILSQAAASMLAQANQSKQSVLALLQ